MAGSLSKAPPDHWAPDHWVIEAAGLSAREGAHLGVQSGLVPRGFVAVHDSLGRHFVDYGNGGLQSGTRGFGIAGFDRGVDLLDIGPNHRTLAGVTHTVTLGLSSAFSRLGTICQRNTFKGLV